MSFNFNDLSEQSSSSSSSSSSTTAPKRIFTRELACMMYGFGDDRNPYAETLNLMEDLVIKYITDLLNKAYQYRTCDRLTIEDIMYAVHNDPKKISRVYDLLTMNMELKQARKAFDEISLQKQPPSSSSSSSIEKKNDEQK
ncbi:Transcription initiation factor TFIID subunit 13 [Dermatophagoides pteronyssinus]|uniref:Transcription initiation factor TFIID subunit 13 n=1 Tax=Dermatophagoides pteronyssinus TaxID=6956 RepID=A0ABQ8JR37_DERPT|nr:Transcription initiation factor TFIID subunit 13 [Dermatophagoides pteronyssinus]